MHKTNSYVMFKSRRHNSVKDQQCALNLFILLMNRKSSLVDFPQENWCSRAPKGLQPALPALQVPPVGRVQRWSHQATASPPIPATALVVFKSWEVAGRNVTENGRKLSRRKNKAFSSPSPKACCPKTAQRLPWRPPLKPGEKQSGN